MGFTADRSAGSPVDPLFDALFRPTGPVPAIGSAAPVRVTGTRTRAGNSMARTRAALLDGARLAVETSGTRITMSQVAACAGVAKATLYNHFRTREAVLSALLEDEIRLIIEACTGQPIARSLTTAATAIADHRLLRSLAEVEPGTLAALSRVDSASVGWRTAISEIRRQLAEAGLGGEPIVLRWLASFMLTPADEAAIAADLVVLLAGLPPVRHEAQALSA